MTTIVYSHKERKIAVDSRESAGSFIYSDNAVKMDVNKHGHWFVSGSVVDVDVIIEGIGKPKRGRFPKIEGVKDFAGIVCDSDGEIFEFYSSEENLMIMKMNDSGAVGSGLDYATAAIDLGKSCGDAIRYAMTRDNATGGKVLVFDCETKEILSHE